MARKRENEEFESRELMEALNRDELTPRLLLPATNRVSQLAPRPQIPITMPPLASHVWHEFDEYRQRGILTGHLIDYAGAALGISPLTHRPISLPGILSSFVEPITRFSSWPLLQLVWHHQNRWRQSNPSRRVPQADLRGLGNDSAMLQTAFTPEVDQSLTTVDELYPKVINQLYLPSLIDREPATPISLLTGLPAYEPDTETLVQMTTPGVGRGGVPPQTRQTTSLSSPYVTVTEGTLAMVNRLPLRVSPIRSPEAGWSPFHETMLPHLSAKTLSRRILSDLGHIQVLPFLPSSYSTTTEIRDRVNDKLPRYTVLPGVYNTAETSRGLQSIEAGERFHRQLDSYKGENLLYLPPEQAESALAGTEAGRIGQSTVPPDSRSISSALRFSTIVPKITLPSKLSSMVFKLPRPLVTSQARWTAPSPVNQGQRTGAITSPQSLANTVQSPAESIMMAADSVSPSQDERLGRISTPFTNIEPLPLLGLPRKPLASVRSVYQTVVSLSQPYIKRVTQAPRADDTGENYGIPWKQEPGYSAQFEDTSQPESQPPSVLRPAGTTSNFINELLLPNPLVEKGYIGGQLTPEPLPIIKQAMLPEITVSEMPLSSLYSETGYQGSQPIPEPPTFLPPGISRNVAASEGPLPNPYAETGYHSSQPMPRPAAFLQPTISSKAAANEGMLSNPYAETGYHSSQPMPEPLDFLQSTTSPKAVASEGLLSGLLTGTSYYDSQPILEMAPLQVEHPPEDAASTAPPTGNGNTEEAAPEAAAPDIEALARAVYPILKWRLATEREQALGVS